MALKDVLRNLNAKVEELKEAAADAQYEAGRQVISKAVELAPRKTGTLRNSNYITKEGNHVEIGFTASYAIYVHEILSNYHPVGQAKFLEVAINDAEIQGIIKKMYQARLSNALKKGKVTS